MNITTMIKTAKKIGWFLAGVVVMIGVFGAGVFLAIVFSGLITF